MILLLLTTLLFTSQLSAVYVQTRVPEEDDTNTEAVDSVIRAARQQDTSATILTLEDALKVALSENIPVKVADKEIQRAKYAKRGTYAALYPQISATLGYQYTIKKQVMYMDTGSSLGTSSGGGGSGDVSGSTSSSGSGSSTGIEFGRSNNFSAGVTASMPLINASLWEGLKISGDAVELAVEKARSSRLDMVTEVKDAYYAVLLAKEAYNVYARVYENAKENYLVTLMKYNAQKASALDLVRSKTTVANAVPNVLNSLNDIDLSLWQLKAVMGLELENNIDVTGSLEDYAKTMFSDFRNSENDTDLSRNSSLRQLDIQVEQMLKTIKMNKYDYIPTLSANFSFTYSAMDNTFNFSEFKWTPYSYVGLSLAIPIFSGMKRLNVIRQSQVQRDELELQRTNAERQLRIAVKSDINTMETYMHSYTAAEAAVQSARKAYEISTESYHVGRSTLVEWNDAQVALTKAELSQWQAVYYFLLSKSDLEKQLGHDASGNDFL